MEVATQVIDSRLVGAFIKNFYDSELDKLHIVNTIFVVCKRFWDQQMEMTAEMVAIGGALKT